MAGRRRSRKPERMDKPNLRLDTTGQYLGGPLAGPHDNRIAVMDELLRQVAALDRVTGH